MSNETLDRVMAEIGRQSEYFSVNELQTMTGQYYGYFARVIFKELMDNALDAAETAGKPPEITIEIAEETNPYTITIAIQDNGNGIKPELLNKMLDFNRRVSDKMIYKAPTRGLQGNAIKTIFGIPYALSKYFDLPLEPIVIETCGIRHTIKIYDDPLGKVYIEREEEKSDIETGTKIIVTIPGYDQEFDYRHWLKSFFIVNPHISVHFREFEEKKHIMQDYKSGGEVIESWNFNRSLIFQGKRNKFMPSNLTSPLWYDLDTFKRLIYTYIYSSNGKSNITLRDFVKQFRSLSGNSQARNVCKELNWITRLQDFKNDEGHIKYLLDVMKRSVKAPSPDILGYTGKEHIKECFELFHDGIEEDKFFYAIEKGEGEKPYIIEMAVARVKGKGGLYHFINFSPTYEDPIMNLYIENKKEKIGGYGLKGFLTASKIQPYDKNIVAAIHIITPSYEVMDKGKTRLIVSRDMQESISKVAWSTCKVLYEEEKKKERERAKKEREEENERKERERKEREQEEKEKQGEKEQKTFVLNLLEKDLEIIITSLIYSPAYSTLKQSISLFSKTLFKNIKNAVFTVLPEAQKNVSDNGRYDIQARALYYEVRAMIQKYTKDELTQSYFDAIIPLYEKAYGNIKGLVRDPRGYMVEPGGREIKLGTKTVSEYNFLEYKFNKILYVEKKGFMNIFNQAKLCEKYDMAIIAGEGYATVAIRDLLKKAEKEHGYRIFVLHDADPAGYDIARTLRESTKKMPDHKLEIIDLGLFLEEALNMGLLTEKFIANKKFSKKLKLSDTERKYFEGQSVYDEKKRTFKRIGERIELNALRPAALVKYVENKLKEHKATDKIIPPAKKIIETGGRNFEDCLKSELQDKIENIIDIGELTDRIFSKLNIDTAFLEDKISSLEEDLDGKSLNWEELIKENAKDKAEEVIEEINIKSEILNYLEEVMKEI